MIVFIRHAEPRSTEADPELTSSGVRMARHAAEWVVAQLPNDRSTPVSVLHTPTRRTAQTAAAVVEWLGESARLKQVEQLPESIIELDVLASKLSGSRPGLPPRPLPPTVLVGHHTTLVGLRRELANRTPAHLLPHTRNYAAGMVLAVENTEWAIRAVWPGRPG